jgi:hypothetical protein
MEQASFSLQEGVVRPVAERVLEQLKAANVLGVSRRMPEALRMGCGKPVQLEALREYAGKLGEEGALRGQGANRLNAIAANPMMPRPAWRQPSPGSAVRKTLKRNEPTAGR